VELPAGGVLDRALGLDLAEPDLRGGDAGAARRASARAATAALREDARAYVGELLVARQNDNDLQADEPGWTLANGDRAQLRATLPIGRVIGPADIARLAVHIMANTALTGGTYDIDGGQQLIQAG
jgi:hypothetical protein